jgi:hypothetical protein
MTTLSKLVLSATLAIAATACGGAAEGQPTGSTCPQGSTITYANFGQTFIQDNCLGCHTNREPLLTTQANVQAAKTEIDKVAAAGPNATNTIMPQDHAVPSDQRTKLGEWLACGAP